MKILHELSWLWETLGIALVAVIGKMKPLDVYHVFIPKNPN